jgi:hypothetical protein
MKLRIPIARITRPSGIALFAVLLSFFAWLCPDFDVLRKGFTVGEQPGILTSFILFSWYLLIFTSLVLGQRLGVAFSAKRRVAVNIPPLDSLFIYRSFTVLAAIGTIWTFLRIFQTLPLLQAAIYIYLGQGNRLKTTLYEGYSAGLLSLRYLVLYSASLAIYRTVKFRKISFLAIANMFLLGTTALISSRLILIATVVVSIFLLTWGKRTIRLSLVKMAVFATLLFVALSILNSSRNKNFYDRRNLSFTESSVSEIVTYLGSPFNVALGAANRTSEITGGPPDLYRQYIDVEDVLTTNSAFVELHEQFGYLAWPYIGVVCCFMGFMFSWLSSFGRTSLLLPCGAILYGAAELWRLDLYREGIFIVWFIAGIGIPGVLLLFAKRRTPRRVISGRIRRFSSVDLPEPQG